MILSAGVGTRFGDDIPKQYHEINGKQVISYVINNIKNSQRIDDFIIVSHSSYIHTLRETYNATVIAGGDNRNKSFRNGLEYIKANFYCDNIIVLDAVRPFISPVIIDKYVSLLNEHQVVATAKKITDSLSSYDSHVIDRERYYLLSSPEAFRFDLLYKHMDSNSPLFEITQQLPENTDIYLYFDYVNDLKITYRHDLPLAELMLNSSFVQI
jgi:2-C-methyl-D-erythritol 4-phosphate cytidylyltransferase